MIFLKKIAYLFWLFHKEWMNLSQNRLIEKNIWFGLFADDDDDNAYNIFKIQEFRLCDCYLDWILHFQLRNKETIFSNEYTTAFFNEIPLEGNDIAADCDIFVVFGKISIVCCERALYHFSYKKGIPHEKFYDECLGYQIECCCLYLLEGKFFFLLFVQIVNLIFLKNSFKRFWKIKNDWNSSWDG